MDQVPPTPPKFLTIFALIISLAALVLTTRTTFIRSSDVYQLNMRLMDDFAIQILYALRDGDDDFLIQVCGLDPRLWVWRHHLTSDFWMDKDTTLGSVDYLVAFDNGFNLHMRFEDTPSAAFYGASTFKVLALGPTSSEEPASSDKRSNWRGRFYWVGPHRVYAH